MLKVFNMPVEITEAFHGCAILVRNHHQFIIQDAEIGTHLPMERLT